MELKASKKQVIEKKSDFVWSLLGGTSILGTGIEPKHQKICPQKTRKLEYSNFSELILLHLKEIRWLFSVGNLEHPKVEGQNFVFLDVF